MSLFGKLFGKAKDDAAAPGGGTETYEGFTIIPEPIAEGGQHRICATIEKDGRQHRLIRADTLTSRDDAVTASVGKARQMIDEQGESLFD